MTLTGTPAKIASSIAGSPSSRARDLDEELGRPARACSCLACAIVLRRVVGQQRRDLQGDPAVDAVGGVVDGPEEVGSLSQILDRQFEKELLIRLALPYVLADGRVIGLALGNGVIEDGGIRGEPGDRQLVDVALERAARQQIAGDVVEPEALTGLAECNGAAAFMIDSCSFACTDLTRFLSPRY